MKNTKEGMRMRTEDVQRGGRGKVSRGTEISLPAEGYRVQRTDNVKKGIEVI